MGKDDYVPWTGGKPKHDWSGLCSTAPTHHQAPNQLRPLKATEAQKGHNFRKIGLTVGKLTRTNLNIPAFEHHVWEHLVNTGMDSIAYVPSPIHGSTEMINVVLEHNRFTLASVTKMIEPQRQKYNSYDLANDSEASHFLSNSLDKLLQSELRDESRPGESFPERFMRNLQLIQLTTAELYSRTKTAIQTRKPNSYPGQNITQMASDMRRDAQFLITARQYDHNLTLNMLDNFLEAGGTNNEDYRYPLRAIKVKLNKALVHIGYLPNKDANQYMSDNCLTYRDICDAAAQGYRTQAALSAVGPPTAAAPKILAPPLAPLDISPSSPTKLLTSVPVPTPMPYSRTPQPKAKPSPPTPACTVVSPATGPATVPRKRNTSLPLAPKLADPPKESLTPRSKPSPVPRAKVARIAPTLLSPLGRLPPRSW